MNYPGPRVRSMIRTSATSLSELAKGTPRPRAYGIHNKAAQKLSAACARASERSIVGGEHCNCMSINCPCACHPRPA